MFGSCATDICFSLSAIESPLYPICWNKLSNNLPSGEILAAVSAGNGFAVGAVESWRGEILTAVHLKNGRIERCFPRDPSFCNWALFAIIGPGNIVPDFPLCNKSLNLSYSGTDM